MIHGCLMHSARLRFEMGDLILGWGEGFALHSNSLRSYFSPPFIRGLGICEGLVCSRTFLRELLLDDRIAIVYPSFALVKAMYNG